MSPRKPGAWRSRPGARHRRQKAYRSRQWARRKKPGGVAQEARGTAVEAKGTADQAIGTAVETRAQVQEAHKRVGRQNTFVALLALLTLLALVLAMRRPRQAIVRVAGNAMEPLRRSFKPAGQRPALGAHPRRRRPASCSQASTAGASRSISRCRTRNWTRNGAALPWDATSCWWTGRWMTSGSPSATPGSRYRGNGYFRGGPQFNQRHRHQRHAALPAVQAHAGEARRYGADRRYRSLIRVRLTRRRR